VLLEEAILPLAFRHIHAANLIQWDLSPSSPEFQKLVNAITVVLLGAVELVHGQGETATRDYLRSLEGQQHALLNEVKVLFVGDGSAGKTSLLKRVIGMAFDKDEPQTHGINIERGVIRNGGQEIRLNLWDFGEQEIMHSTHQFFLSKRSLYVLVLDGRKEEDAEYWLQHIRIFGGNSPIIVVLNKIDEHPSFEVNRKFLQDKYHTIVEFHRVSCRTNDGVHPFTDTLNRAVKDIEHLKTTWPQPWFKVKHRLEDMAADYISYEKYDEICRAEGLDEESTLDTLADFLNDLGVVLHFDLPVLKETTVINPQWITGAVYQIINSKELAEGKGLLHRNALKTILSRATYPTRKHDYIIELMKRFELCFSVGAETVLVPDLLAVGEPTFNFNFDNALRYQLEYEFLPKSVIPRVIVNLNTDIKDSLRWRTGVVLEDDAFGSMAVIKADAKEKKVSVWVAGEQRREYFSIIRKVFLDVNGSFPGLIVREKVPCSCRECKGRETPHFFDYNYLVKKRQKGKLTVDCERSIEEVAIDELLAGIETPMMDHFEEWDVFVSYSSKDVDKINDIIEDLKRHHINCWWDHEQVQPGDVISRKIELGLRRSRFIMPCISRNQVLSGWCRVEYTAVLDRVLRGKTSQKVTPLILDDLPENDMPLLLSDFRAEHWRDSRSYERLVRFLSRR
jgi:small GTP-binding protein